MSIAENVKIYQHPKKQPVEFVESLGVGMAAFKDKKTSKITVIIDPSVGSYEEIELKSGGHANLILLAADKDTFTLDFDFKNNNVQEFTHKNETITMKLMSEPSEKIEGEEMKYFHFFITAD